MWAVLSVSCAGGRTHVSGMYIERGFDGRCLAVNGWVYHARREDFSFEEERDAYCFEEFNSKEK